LLGTLVRVITDLKAPAVRRFTRSVALTPAILLGLAAGPAVAAPPEGWPQAEPVSTLHVLVILVAIPVALFAIISLLVHVPSMARGEAYTPGLAWHHENEWFGGPRGGVEAADTADPKAIEGVEEGRSGGASARW
jgi:hypothetical protein